MQNSRRQPKKQEVRSEPWWRSLRHGKAGPNLDQVFHFGLSILPEYTSNDVLVFRTGCGSDLEADLVFFLGAGRGLAGNLIGGMAGILLRGAGGAGNIERSRGGDRYDSIAQKAALEAVRGPQDSVAAMLAEYRKRRDY